LAEPYYVVHVRFDSGALIKLQLHIQSVPELAYIPLTANVNIYSKMDSARKIV
jgi:hypothetical protein